MGGGTSQPVLDRIRDLENKYESLAQALPGKLDASKVTSSTTVTEMGYAADARQLNPAVAGSLAGQVQSIKDNEANLYALKGGEIIPDGADLDTYKEVGNYCCAFNGAAQSLLNSPTRSAFSMKVELGSGIDYPVQTIRNFDNGNLYFRMYNKYANVWTSWRVIRTEDV